MKQLLIASVAVACMVTAAHSFDKEYNTKVAAYLMCVELRFLIALDNSQISDTEQKVIAAGDQARTECRPMANLLRESYGTTTALWAVTETYRITSVYPE